MEVEVKFHLSEDEANAVRAKLAKNFTLVKRVVQSDVYFSHPRIDLNDRVFRLRKEGKRVILTYKGPRLSHNLKVREELEVEVSEFAEMKKILRNLGFIETATIEKIRETYLVDSNAFVNLDKVKGLGYFIEVELITDITNFDSITRKIREITSVLGLNHKRALSVSYFELLQRGSAMDLT